MLKPLNFSSVSIAQALQHQRAALIKHEIITIPDIDSIDREYDVFSTRYGRVIFKKTDELAVSKEFNKDVAEYLFRNSPFIGDIYLDKSNGELLEVTSVHVGSLPYLNVLMLGGLDYILDLYLNESTKLDQRAIIGYRQRLLDCLLFKVVDNINKVYNTLPKEILTANERYDVQTWCAPNTNVEVLGCVYTTTPDYWRLYNSVYHFTRHSKHRNFVYSSSLKGIIEEGFFLLSARNGTSPTLSNLYVSMGALSDGRLNKQKEQPIDDEESDVVLTEEQTTMEETIVEEDLEEENDSVIQDGAFKSVMETAWEEAQRKSRKQPK